MVPTGEGSDAQAAAADRDAIEVTLELVDGVAFLHAVYTPVRTRPAGAAEWP